MEQLELTYREFRLLVLAINQIGLILKRDSYCFADRSAANDVLAVGNRVDNLLMMADRSEKFVVTIEERDDEEADEYTETDEAVHSEGEPGNATGEGASAPATPEPVIPTPVG